MEVPGGGSTVRSNRARHLNRTGSIDPVGRAENVAEAKHRAGIVELKPARYFAAYFLPLTVVFVLVTDARLLTAEKPAAASQPSILEVVYDPASDLVSIRARHSSLGNVLQELAKKAHLDIDWRNDELVTEPVSADIEALPLEQALHQLLREFNSAFVYSPASDTQTETATPRLASVILLSRRVRTALEAHAATGARAETKSATDLRPAVDRGAELIRALIENDSHSAKGLVESLKDSGRERERENAVEALLGLLNYKDFRASYGAVDPLTEFAPEKAYYGALDALKELAPEKAVEALTQFLQGNDQEMRVAGLTGLGYLGHERGIEPLVSVLNANDPSTHLVTASSLARIGGERGPAILFRAYLTGDSDLKHAVAAAIAFHGDEAAKSALAHIITGGQMPEGTTPENVIRQSLPPDNARVGK